MQAAEIQNCSPLGYGTMWLSPKFESGHTVSHLLMACEDTSRMLLESTHNQLPDCTVSQPRPLMNPHHFEHLISCTKEY